jgi:hypothetical protein
MMKDMRSLIILILGIAVGVCIYIIRYDKPVDSVSEDYSEKIFHSFYRYRDSIEKVRDSLINVNRALYHEIDFKNVMIDSLRGEQVKTKVVYYERYKKFIDINAVSDDSISLYIAKRLYEWKGYTDSLYSE